MAETVIADISGARKFWNLHPPAPAARQIDTLARQVPVGLADVGDESGGVVADHARPAMSITFMS
jgi:hypothetical protein